MKTLNQYIFFLFSTLIFYFNGLNAYSQVVKKNSIVVSDNKIASQVGIDILKKGGNAIDASIATAFALAVTFPSAGNIGGGGFLIYLNSNNNVTTIDFREKAPINSHQKMFQNKNGELIKGLNHNSIISIGVPGTVSGLYMAHQKYGKLSWKELVQPSIKLAEKGFIMTNGLYESIVKLKMNKSQYFLKKYFLNDQNKIVMPGETFRQMALSKTLKSIYENGRDGFYKGWVADEIVSYMKKNKGLITHKDLEMYRAIEREPIVGSFKEYNVYSMAPPSSGGVTLISMLNIIEQANLENLTFNSVDYIHLLAEIMRIAYKDRAKFLGDPDFNIDMPLDLLTSKSYAKARFKTIDLEKASKSVNDNYFHPFGGDNTTHISVIDNQGNAVSLTYTLEYSFGSGMGSSKLGFIFNNEMGDFNPVSDLTTNDGLIGTSPNLIEPEKRMLSSMTPTIITKKNRPFLIIGSPGGRTIINTVFQTILNVIVFKMKIKQAIEANKIHHQWMPDEIKHESFYFSKNLKSMGHNLIEVEKIGNLMGILYDENEGVYAGVSDSNSIDGAAVGY